MGAVELRPLGVGELLDVAIRLALRNAGTLLRAVVVVVLPLQVISAIVYVSGQDDSIRNANGQFAFDRNDAWTLAVSLAVVFLISAVTPLLASGVCLKAVGDAYLGGTADWRSSLRFTLGRFHSILWIGFLAGVGGVLGAIACILPGIWLWISWAVAVPVLLIEGSRGRKALGRSFRLVKGRWWGCFGALLLAYLLVGLVSAGINAVLAAISLSGSGHGEVIEFALRTVSGSVSSMITTPFTAALTVVLYIDLRVRKEGFDVQLLAAQIGLEPGAVARLPDPPSETQGGPTGPPPPASGDAPPFWPPPPGWRPREAE
jgi:hypothetical protein